MKTAKAMKPAHTLAAASVALLLSGTALPATALAESATYRVDPDHTFVTFEVIHFNTSTVRGRFDRVEGTIRLDPAAKTGRAEIAVNTGSIDSGVAEFDAHLKSADFLDTQKEPSARFVGEKFDFKGDKLSSVSGTLTLLGKALPVTLNAVRFNCYWQPVLKADVCGGDFETTLERSQWGMNWGLDMGVPDQVHIVIQIEAVKG